MSANLDLMRSIYADWEREDFSNADWAHLEMEYTIADGPQPGTWIGHMPKGFRDWTSALEGYRTEAEEYRELDAGRVLVLTRASGAPVEATHLALYTLSGGKVTQLQVFDDRQQALEAAGLAE